MPTEINGNENDKSIKKLSKSPEPDLATLRQLPCLTIMLQVGSGKRNTPLLALVIVLVDSTALDSYMIIGQYFTLASSCYCFT